MSIKLSKALRNHLLWQGSWKNALQGGVLKLYGGVVPASADDPTNGGLLATFTDTAGAYTAEVLAVATLTLTGGGSGSVNTVTVGGVNLIPNVGAVPFNSSLTQTASDLANAINRDQIYARYTATANGAVVTIYGPPGTGATFNGVALAATTTTITTSVVNFASGVASANGLRFSTAAGGVLAKDPFQIWRTIPVGTDTATYFRIVSPRNDADVGDPSEAQVRLQGDVGTTNAALNLLTTSIATGAMFDINTFVLTEPAS